MMCKKQYHIMAMLTGLALAGGAQAEQATLFTESHATHLTQINSAEESQSTLDLDFKTGQRIPSFEQVQSANDDDTRVNVAMNLALPKKEALNLQVGALSLEFPEDTNKPIEVDVRPFFYVGVGRSW